VYPQYKVETLLTRSFARAPLEPQEKKGESGEAAKNENQDSARYKKRRA
jgi:hypothetical protein